MIPTPHDAGYDAGYKDGIETALRIIKESTKGCTTDEEREHCEYLIWLMHEALGDPLDAFHNDTGLEFGDTV